MATGPLITVRGTAELSVAPDVAELRAAVTLLRDSKQDAMRAAASALGLVLADLRSLGGSAVAAGERRALTWAAGSVQTWADHQLDREPRTSASVQLALTVRDFTLLPALGGALAGHEHLELHAVQWRVDDDNAGWPLVRAEAIHAALRRGGDYAAALGCAVDSVEQVADAGLLDGGRSPGPEHAATLFARTASGVPDSPALDPVPQVLSASIDARLTTTRLVAEQT